MRFSSCLRNIQDSDKGVIDACLQLLFEDDSIDQKLILSDLSNGISAGMEYAFIYIDGDWENEIPNFSGICFDYFDERVVINRESANQIIENVINKLNIDFRWLGFGKRK